MNKVVTWLTVGILVLAVSLVGLLAVNNYLRIQVLGNIDFDVATEPDEQILQQAEVVLAEAEQAVDLAFNLLGIFEALSLAITIGGVVLTAFGLTRFTTARNELEEARRLVEKELEEARNRFESAIVEREQEIKEMRVELTEAAEMERQRTSGALLANALIPLGERQYRTSDYQGALNTYMRARELDPNNPVINQRIGYVYAQSGELEAAKKHYEFAIQREHDFAPALAGLGYVYRRFGEDAAKIALDNMPEEERTQKLIQRDQLLNESEDLLLQALKLSPKLVDDDGESYWGILGGLYKRRGQIDQAIEAYQKVIEVTPQSSYGYVNLALLYQKKNERNLAIKTYEMVEQIASKEAEAEAGNFWGYSDLISSSFAIGKHEQAQQALPIAMSIAPIDSPYMLQGLTDTLRDLVDFLDSERVPPINEAIKILEAEMKSRQKSDAE